MVPIQHLEELAVREQAATLVGHYFQQAWNERRLWVIDDLFAWDVVIHAGGEPLQGRAAMRQIVATFLEAFPDAAHTMHETICEGDRVVARWTAAGTQQGDWMGIPPTGLPFQLDGITIFRLQDSRIAELWTVSDMMGLLQCLWQ